MNANDAGKTNVCTLYFKKDGPQSAVAVSSAVLRASVFLLLKTVKHYLSAWGQHGGYCFCLYTVRSDLSFNLCVRVGNLSWLDWYIVKHDQKTVTEITVEKGPQRKVSAVYS